MTLVKLPVNPVPFTWMLEPEFCVLSVLTSSAAPKVTVRVPAVSVAVTVPCAGFAPCRRTPRAATRGGRRSGDGLRQDGSTGYSGRLQPAGGVTNRAHRDPETARTARSPQLLIFPDFYIHTA